MQRTPAAAAAVAFNVGSAWDPEGHVLLQQKVQLGVGKQVQGCQILRFAPAH
jgi:hypothetical protein